MGEDGFGFHNLIGSFDIDVDGSQILYECSGYYHSGLNTFFTSLVKTDGEFSEYRGKHFPMFRYFQKTVNKVTIQGGKITINAPPSWAYNKMKAQRKRTLQRLLREQEVIMLEELMNEAVVKISERRTSIVMVPVLEGGKMKFVMGRSRGTAKPSQGRATNGSSPVRKPEV